MERIWFEKELLVNEDINFISREGLSVRKMGLLY